MKIIELTRGKVAIVDDVDFETLSKFNWNAQKDYNTWYAYRAGTSGTTVSMHRQILGAPNGMKVDHRDGDGLHNWRDNLRLATGTQNQANRGKQRNNTSGYKGVSYYGKYKRWRSKIKIHGKSIHLGYFSNPSEAARAYDKAAIELHGEFANLNFPRGGPVP